MLARYAFGFSKSSLSPAFGLGPKPCLQVRKSSDYRPAPTWKPPHLDDLPVPEGSWKSHYNLKQRSYNRQLLTGILLFSLPLFVFLKSERFFFNAFPPPLPEEEDEFGTFNPPC